MKTSLLAVIAVIGMLSASKAAAAVPGEALSALMRQIAGQLDGRGVIQTVSHSDDYKPQYKPRIDEKDERWRDGSPKGGNPYWWSDGSPKGGNDYYWSDGSRKGGSSNRTPAEKQNGVEIWMDGSPRGSNPCTWSDGSSKLGHPKSCP